VALREALTANPAILRVKNTPKTAFLTHQRVSVNLMSQFLAFGIRSLSRCRSTSSAFPVHGIDLFRFRNSVNIGILYSRFGTLGLRLSSGRCSRLALAGIKFSPS
jgi:hypothetical protein